MPKSKRLQPLTPRAREIVNLVINCVALGTHDNDGEIGVMAKQLDMTPARLQMLLAKLQEQGWLIVKRDFVYPTVEALRWQNPELSEGEARKVLRSLR
jgi:DNA-binding IclR family transcriptional regulator